MMAELASLGNNISRVTVPKYLNKLGLRSKLSKNSRLQPTQSIIPENNSEKLDVNSKSLSITITLLKSIA